MRNANPMAKKSSSNQFLMVVLAWSCAIIGGIVAIVQSARLTAYANDASTMNVATDTLATIAEYEDKEVIIPTSLFTLPDKKTYTGRKSYESYTAITDKSSMQYQLQQLAVTNEDAFRMIDDRYLVAIGTYFEAPCGSVIDIILENGTIIPAIVGDIKADADTDIWHIFTENGCATEFIVDAENTNAQLTGDVSSLYDEWQSKVKAIRVYDGLNILAA